MLSACHEQQIELHNDEEPSTESNTVTKENAVSVEYEPAETVQNHGRFAEAYLSVLDKGQQTVILEYFEAYYMTLATLEHRDISMLFSNDANRFVDLHDEVWDYMVEVRKMQSADLRMISYHFTIDDVLVEQLTDEYEQNASRISLTVDSRFRFAAFPEIETEEYGMMHYFTLIETENGWRVQEHIERGNLYRAFLGEDSQQLWMEDQLDLSDASKQWEFEAIKESLLKRARLNVDLRSEQGKTIDELKVDVPYNRLEAKQYAEKWIDKRNESWFDYGNYGGNCQNFASQCLLAGGIPMDIAGYQWKWYDDRPNEKKVRKGRSPAWTGVEKFVEYAGYNEGFGLAATVEAPYDQGEIGDLIIMGYDDKWRHTVIITDVITNDQGEFLDYLVASNTVNQRHFPVSAHMYTRQILVKIHGWNR